MSRVLLFGLAFVSGLAQADPAAWRISHASAPGELLVLGSIHVLRQQDYPLPPIVDTLYGQADAVVMELELDAIDAMTMQTGLMSAAIIEGGGGLSKLLEPDLYMLAERQAGELGVPLAMLEGFEPWFVAITLSSIGIVKLGYQPEMGLEQYILSRARRDGKDIVGLETLQDQVTVFDSLSASDQSALLEQTLLELRSTDAMMQELIQAWQDGELERLSAQLLDDFQQFPMLYDRLVAERNATWADQLAGMMENDDRLLVVVGALHLVGEKNVIDLLDARGFEVEQLR